MKKRHRLKVIECSGTFFEIGEQYGMACRDNLVSSIESVFRDIGMMNRAEREEITAMARKFLPAVEKYDPELIEMLRGQAEGARVTFDQLFTLRCKLELGMYYQRIKSLCTSFIATGEATRGGKTIIGQTYDLTPGTSVDLVRTLFPDGMRQLSLVFAGGGAGELPLNSAGIGMALNIMLSPVEARLSNVPCTCVIPRAMRQKRIGDALGIICGSGRSILYYGFASAEGDIIGIETRPDMYNVIQPERDMLVHANNYLTEEFKASERIGMVGRACSYIRLQRLNRLMEKHYGDITVEVMEELLADHNNYPNSICGHVNEELPPAARGQTLAAVIMLPEDGVMYATGGQPCLFEFEEYTV